MNNSQKMQSELFIVLALVFLLVAVQLIPKNRDINTDNTKKGKAIDSLTSAQSDNEKAIDSLINALSEQNKVIDSLKRKANLGVPVFYLSEEEKNFRFRTGSYDLDYYYRVALDEKIKEIDSIASLYPEYNAIEIIGHTDGQPIKKNNRYYNNMDERTAYIVSEFHGGGNYSYFKANAGSNVDLGILRAMSVATYIKKSSREDRFLQNIKYWFPYSAGAIMQGGGYVVTYSEAKKGLTKDDLSRRRIEIRLLKYDK